MPYEIDIAWAAGLFEGEGSIFEVKQPSSKKKSYTYIRMGLKTTDLDVLEKFHKIVKFGTITPQTEKVRAKLPVHYKKCWYWQLSNRYEIIVLLMLFIPHLGIRRKSKINELLPGMAK